MCVHLYIHVCIHKTSYTLKNILSGVLLGRDVVSQQRERERERTGGSHSGRASPGHDGRARAHEISYRCRRIAAHCIIIVKVRDLRL